MSVTAAKGFRAAGVASGIKPEEALDVALVAGAPGTIAAGVFTTNAAAAPPIELSRSHLAAGPSVQAVVINSGCANAGTGDNGMRVAATTAKRVASALGCLPEEVLVCSTGPIGPQLDPAAMERGVELGIAALSFDAEAATDAATAIMTTDSVPKEAITEADGFTVGGMAKGAGMVRPDMATMLAVLTTDAAVAPDVLTGVLRRAVDGSFHGLNLDGCQSTNDAVVLMASGTSGKRVDTLTLGEAVLGVCRSLTRQMAADAEGASRVVTVRVEGADSDDDARVLGMAVADSSLVRASFYGGDPNWGRVLGALGAAPRRIDPSRISVFYGSTSVAARGVAVPCDEDALVAELAAGDFTVQVTVGDGPGRFDVLTTDLTPDYVKFNGERS